MQSSSTDVREMWEEFMMKQDEPLYIRNVLSGLAGIMLVFTSAFFICALVVAGIDNAGFNVVLTGLLLAVWEVGTMWLMKRGPHETSLGFLIGVTLVMNLIVIMTAIYWGQLSDCDTDYDGDYDQYSCSNRSAMRGVAAFASIIWVIQLPFIYLVVLRRQTLTREDSFDEGRYGDYGDGAYDGWGKGNSADTLGSGMGSGAMMGAGAGPGGMPAEQSPSPPPETRDL